MGAFSAWLSGLPLVTTAPQPDWMTIVITSGGPKRMPPPVIKDGTIPNGTPVVLDVASLLGYLQVARLTVDPAASTSILIEFSRDGGSTYTSFGTWTSRAPLVMERLTTDVNYVTHVRLTRTVGSGSTSLWRLEGGTSAFSSVQEDARGRMDCFDLVTTLIGGSYVAYADDTFRGRCARIVGTDVSLIQIKSEVFTAWDDLGGSTQPFFAFVRVPNPATGFAAAAFCLPAPAVNRGTVANQAARLALSSAVVGDYCYQTDVAQTFTLTTAGYSTNANWTQNPANVPGDVQVNNPDNYEPTPGMPVVVMRLGPNRWVYA